MSTISAIKQEVFQNNKSRISAINDHPSVFADIYQEDINIAVWERDLTPEIKTSVENFLQSHGNYRTSLNVTPETVIEKLIHSERGFLNSQALCNDISELVEMFCVLFDLKHIGLRLTVLDEAMCPRFHVDRVPSRLVCTYHGVASEWLPHDLIDRSKLGRGNNGLSDEESGLYRGAKNINQLKVGDVALLKGELWEGNENAGLVHRSPQVTKEAKRLLLTLDFLS